MAKVYWATYYLALAMMKPYDFLPSTVRPLDNTARYYYDRADDSEAVRHLAGGGEAVRPRGEMLRHRADHGEAVRHLVDEVVRPRGEFLQPRADDNEVVQDLCQTRYN